MKKVILERNISIEEKYTSPEWIDPYSAGIDFRRQNLTSVDP